MIIPGTVNETIKVYEKHGWVLRRLSVPGPILETLDGIDEGVTRVADEFGAAWFSRPPEAGPIAWELRYLGEPPYALVEHLDENSPEFEAELRAVESRLREIVAGRRTA